MVFLKSEGLDSVVFWRWIRRTFSLIILVYLIGRSIPARADEIRSMMEYIYANNLAIKRYDAIVKEHFVRTAVESGEESLLGYGEWDAKARVWIDYENHELVYLRIYTAYAANETGRATKDANFRQIELTFYGRERKFHVRSRYASGVHADLVQRPINLPASDFATVMQRYQVPCLDFTTFVSIYYPLRMDREEFVLKRIWTDDTAVISRLADGTSTIFFPKQRIDSGVGTRIILDPVTQMTRSKTATSSKDGKIYNHLKEETFFEEVGGIYRTRHIQMERRTYGPNKSANSSTLVPVDEIGTVEIDWLQFNGDQIVFPSHEEFVKAPDEWLKLLNVTP